VTVIIGSTAARYWFPDFPREPKDFDTFSATPVEGAENFWHPKLEKWFHDFSNNYRHAAGYSKWYASPNELYTIKISHLYWDLKNNTWDKHAGDVVWLKNHGARLYEELHNLLREIWTEVHGSKKVSLKMSAGQFFDDAVQRVYDHDSIHESVAYGDHALYIDFLKPGEEIAIDMAAVKSAPFDTQVLLYREEIAATALERLVIPSNYRCSPRRAWRWALRRTVTSLTRGWSAKFIATNLEHFIEPHKYVERHKEQLHKLIPLGEI
jgi:hypothetical protein